MSDLEQFIASMTVGDLARLARKTPSQIAAFALSGSATTAAVRKPRPPKPRPEKPGPWKPAKASTRTAAGRGDFESKILAAIRAAGGPVRSVELEAQVGGNPMQRRAALKRLVKARKIKREGVARATTYAAR
jgi:hypothetical protein